MTLPDWGTNFGCTDATFTYSLQNLATSAAPAAPFSWSSLSQLLMYL